MTAEPQHRRPVPPTDGCTVDGLLTLPGLPPHTELIDGSLVVRAPQRDFHSVVIDLLTAELRGAVPADLRVRREMTVELDRRNAPEPDVSVVRRTAVVDRRQTRFQARDVVLAVEVVSPDSEARDRDTKPLKYAVAGIPHFWLVEMGGREGHPVVHVHELDPVTRRYTPTGIHRERLKLRVPFDLDIDLTGVGEL